MKNKLIIVAAFAAPVFLGGCSSLSMGKSDFSCKAPEGVSCKSVSGVYANAVENNLPGQNQGARLVENDGKENSQIGLVSKGFLKPKGELVKPPSLIKYDSQNILQKEKVMRVAIFPWMDKDKVLHDKSYVYMIVEDSKWREPHTSDKKNIPHFGKTFGFDDRGK